MLGISRRELRIYLIVVGSITLVALLITLIFLLPGYISYHRTMTLGDQTEEEAIDMSKFMIPDSYKRLYKNSWDHFLPDKEKWTWSDIDPYWHDPREMILDYLEKQNENIIDDIFKDIP